MNRIAITGASGLVGRALDRFLQGSGHLVIPLVRHDPVAGEIRWDPTGPFDTGPLERVDVLVHLAGESIAGRRWNATKKQRIRQSRVEATRNLCHHLARMDRPPSTLLCASAIGYYGDRGDEMLDEQSPPGRGFLAQVGIDWEAAAAPAVEAGIRVVHLRLGMVLSPDGGALAMMLPIFRLGLGGRLGSGRQFWSWIAIDDVVSAIGFAMERPDLDGPVNVVAPQPVRNIEFTRTLAGVLHRPALLPAPSFLLRLGLGEMADELLLASARVRPRRLEEAGFQFCLPQLDVALRTLLQDRRT
ncbi:MAG: TIGR01777 family protein [Planctomycetota bacterium]|nr:MAG: TIGR01777 family protein [Planctomycetota bacterium]